jgi:two-component system response regulator AlgR
MRRLLEQCEDCTVVGEAASADEALVKVASHRPDTLLLDISMPGLDGMGLARALKRQRPAPAVIFCTAWPDRALDAFDCDAVDYLLKPVRGERLRAALDKARRTLQTTSDDQGGFLQATIGARTRLIDISHVACLLAEDKYTTVVYDEGQAVISESLVELEQAYQERFVRVHRNALVAVDRVRGLERADGGGHRVLLQGCDLRPAVSRRQLPALRRLIRTMT